MRELVSQSERRIRVGRAPPRFGLAGVCKYLVGTPAIGVDLLAQFKSDRPPGFLLPDGCAIRRVTAGGDILDPDGNDITPTKLAVDRQIEHG
jgi:hypothetical protein